MGEAASEGGGTGVRDSAGRCGGAVGASPCAFVCPSPHPPLWPRVHANGHPENPTWATSSACTLSTLPIQSSRNSARRCFLRGWTCISLPCLAPSPSPALKLNGNGMRQSHPRKGQKKTRRRDDRYWDCVWSCRVGCGVFSLGFVLFNFVFSLLPRIVQRRVFFGGEDARAAFTGVRKRTGRRDTDRCWVRHFLQFGLHPSVRCSGASGHGAPRPTVGDGWLGRMLVRCLTTSRGRAEPTNGCRT
ncbi:hypothetical protein B0H19DRAFT_1138385 [Mycena capillaripes]|nr:hypothetical protein B0H19DRAFT_1138385 [Mycena capillaripes]